MPDIDAFKSEIASINVRISDEVSEESTRLKLLTVSATSEATAVYWAENQEQILADMRNAAEHWTGEHSAMMRTKHSSSTMYGPASSDPPNDGDGGSSCCFQGEFQWSWSDFGSSVVGGAAWGASIVGGAVTGGGAYAGYQFTQWMFSEEVEVEDTTDEGDQDR